jgi:AGZA family xanthine/uracil permease-like MFS transporter
MPVPQVPDEASGQALLPAGQEPGPESAAPISRYDRYFSLTARGSNLRREITAGVSTFLALSYIVVVNPAILGQAGIPPAAALLATALVGGLATIAMGVFARLPFAVAPGMEMNALVAVSVVGILGYTWQQALGMVFWSGVAMLVVSAFKLRQVVIDAIPGRARAALTAAVAVFIGLVGLQISGVLTSSDGHISGTGSLTSPGAWALYLGLATALAVDRLRWRAGAVIASVVVAALYCRLADVLSPSTGSADGSWAALFRFDLAVALRPSAWSIILVLFALDFFGSIAKVVALTSGTPIQQDGSVPGMPQALLADASATMVGSSVGSSSFIVYVESAVGIRAGARTGIAAITTGLLLLCCLVLGPVLTYVPTQAVTGTLVFVALKMITHGVPRDSDPATLVVIATTMAVTLATLAIDQAMALAFALCVGIEVLRRRRPHPALVVATLLLFASAVLQRLQLA